MLDILDDDTRRGISVVLDKIKIMKMLRDRGIDIGKHKLDPDPDMEMNNHEDFGERLLPKLIGPYGEVDVVNNEGGEYYDMWSPDEVTVFEVCISDPWVMEYHRLLREYGEEDDKDFCYKIARIFNEEWINDYQWYEFYRPIDESVAFRLVFTDYTFFDSHFVESYLWLIDYCKDYVERKRKEKDGELSKEQRCS